MPNGTKDFLSLLCGSVGRKVLVALTGFFMVLFIMAHLAGNLTILGGPGWINSYGEHLHRLPVLLWPLRLLMLLALSVHVLGAITLTLENRRAGRGKYAVVRMQKTTFAGKTMIWTGLLLLAFLAYHILHFSLHWTPGVLVVDDGSGRQDVYSMIVAGFGSRPVAGAYFASIFILFLHVSHGIQSLFQSLGLANDRTLPKLGVFARILSAVFLAGFGLIPFLASFAVLQ